MRKKCKKFYVFLNCIEHLLIKLALITGCASVLPLFCQLVLLGITSSAVELKIYLITAEIKVLLAKSKLNPTEVLISKDFINSHIYHDELFH